ncbi:MAG: phytanoyl-CoA dioxygenase family protein [Neisseriaceae bacterium]
MMMSEMICKYNKDGFLINENTFSNEEIEFLSYETEKLATLNSPGLVKEEHLTGVRSIIGANKLSNVMDCLSKDPRLLYTAQKLLRNDELYIHQYKINMKRAFTGDVWDWHSDFFYWNIEDGMPEPKALTAAIFLDDVNDFNSPLLIVPGTQEDKLTTEHHVRPYGDMDCGENWEITFSTKLKHEISRSYLTSIINKNGLTAVKGKRGTVVFFHCNVIHYSNFNASPWDRRIIFITYNLTSNALKLVTSPRPEFLASRNFTPIQAGEISSFLKYSK